MAVLFATPAWALDVINQDAKAYKLIVKNPAGSTTKFSVRANGSISGICNDPTCTVMVKGGNSVTTSKDSKLIINGGQLKKWM